MEESGLERRRGKAEGETKPGAEEARLALPETYNLLPGVGREMTRPARDTGVRLGYKSENGE